MAVDLSVQLPAQPASGSVRYEPLGGDGERSPDMMCTFRVNSTGDATGGNHIIRVLMDPTKLWVLNWCRHAVVNALTNWESIVFIVPTGLFTEAQLSFATTVTTVATSTFDAHMLAPPPVFLQKLSDSDAANPQIYASKANVDAENVNFQGQMLGYNINAAKRTPIDVLLASIPRAFQVWGGGA